MSGSKQKPNNGKLSFDAFYTKKFIKSYFSIVSNTVKTQEVTKK